tara:strand:+ start:1367 stop:2233 length:867 start_codon:yes stop_codon:yes gene_type:complete
MKCYLCGHKNFNNVDGKLRDDDFLTVLECGNCSLKQLSSFEHIDENYYEDNKMMECELSFKEDCQSWARDGMIDDDRRIEHFKQDIVNKKILDFGAGVSNFALKSLKLARDVTSLEVSEKMLNYNKSLNSKLSIVSNLSELKETDKFDTIFLFHVLEHIADPISLINSLIQHLEKDGNIIIEVPNADDALITLYNSESYKNFYYWKCHLFYYTSHTLRRLFAKIGVNVDYIKQVQRYPLSNHLHWLNKGQPGGHKSLNFLDSKIMNLEYENILSKLGKCDTLVCRINK